jgi:hypothetical protein
MSHSASEKTFSEETLLSVLEFMFAIICDNNSDGAAKMFQVNGISHAFIEINICATSTAPELDAALACVYKMASRFE